MKILILGSVALPVPPPMQGGTERIAYYQAIGLANIGHTITLVAANGSSPDPRYRLICIGKGDTVSGSHLELDTQIHVESSRKLRKEMVYLSEVSQWLLDHNNDYEIIINNMRGGEALFASAARILNKKYVNVMHLPIFAELAENFRIHHTWIITISNAQQKQFPGLNYAGTVYNCVDISKYPFSESSDNYLLMMGSIAPHKNQKAGILVAKASKKKLILAGKIGNQAYYDKEILPHIDGAQIVHIGELGMEEKVRLYQRAHALLFPVLWEEPFGLVMIEAMSCGTPVVAYSNGAVPEVVVDGKTGFIVTSELEMIEALKKMGEIKRAACKHHIEENFTVEKMVYALQKAITRVCSI